MAATTPEPRRTLGTVVHKDRNSQGGFDLFETEPVTEIFADGVTQGIINSFTTRILFHRVESTASNTQPLVENRRAVVSLVMPTSSWLQLAVFILEQLAATRDGLAPPIQTFLEQLAALEPRIKMPTMEVPK